MFQAPVGIGACCPGHRLSLLVIPTLPTPTLRMQHKGQAQGGRECCSREKRGARGISLPALNGSIVPVPAGSGWAQHRDTADIHEPAEQTVPLEAGPAGAAVEEAE